MKAYLTQYTPCFHLAANLTVELNDLKIIPSNYQELHCYLKNINGK